MIEPVLLIGAFLVGLLAFANGSNDVSKGIATLIGSGVSDIRTALRWGTAWTFVGGLLGLVFSLALVKTFTQGILAVPLESMSAIVPLAVTIGAIGWVLAASRFSMPVSTTHAITGALCGAGIAAWGLDGVQWLTLFKKVILPLAVSPFLALGLTFLVLPVVRRLMKDWKGLCVCLLPTRRARLAMNQSSFVRMIPGETEIQTIVNDPACDSSDVLSLRIGPDTFHWITSGLTSLARGMNDGPKMVAMLVGLSLVSGGNGQSLLVPGFVLVAVGMAAGSYIGGRRVTAFLAERITKMDHLEGFAANLATSVLVAFAARLGFPVSTTHLSASAILGIGLRKGLGGVHWKPVSEMLLAWVVTIPVSGILAAGIYWILKTIVS